MQLVNLRHRPELIPEYIALRNKYSNELMSVSVDMDTTTDWMRCSTATMLGAVNNALELVGACVIYPERYNELALFVKYPHQMIGSFIIENMGPFCRANGIAEVWARVKGGNVRAHQFFEKMFGRPELVYRKKI